MLHFVFIFFIIFADLTAYTLKSRLKDIERKAQSVECLPSSTAPECRNRIINDPDSPLLRKVRAHNHTKPKPLKLCEPYSDFPMDCNKCLCDSTGYIFSCTRFNCRVENGLLREDIECLPSNTDPKCRIRVMNYPKPPPLIKVPARNQTTTPKSPVCEPYSDFPIDCNKCLCDSTGYIFSCTRLDCRVEGQFRIKAMITHQTDPCTTKNCSNPDCTYLVDCFGC